MADIDKDRDRGEPVAFDPATGEVRGSGANAGGGGTGTEDYDSDPQGGGGAEPVGGPRPIGKAEHPPRDRHQGSPR